MDTESMKQQIGTNLARLRRDRGFTQESLAHECGLEVTTVASIERARRLPSVPTLIKLAEALKVTPNDLFETTRSPRMTEKENRLHALMQLLAKRTVSEIELVTDLAKTVLR